MDSTQDTDLFINVEKLTSRRTLFVAKMTFTYVVWNTQKYGRLRPESALKQS